MHTEHTSKPGVHAKKELGTTHIGLNADASVWCSMLSNGAFVVASL